MTLPKTPPPTPSPPRAGPFVPASTPGGGAPPASALERIEAKLDRIERRLSRLDPLLELAPGLVAVAGDTFDEVAADMGDADARILASLATLERITRPQTLDRLRGLLDAAEAAPGLIAVLGDTFDEFAARAAREGIDLARVLPDLAEALFVVLKLLSGEGTQTSLRAALAPEHLAVLEKTANAVAVAVAQPERAVGPLGALAALRDPHTKRAIGFALAVARQFGSQLESKPVTHTSGPGRLPASTEEKR